MRQRFPWGILYPVSGLSFADRLLSLRRYRVGRLLDIPVPSKPRADYTLVTLVSQRDLLMGKAGMASAVMQAEALPRMLVVCDKSTTPGEVRAFFGSLASCCEFQDVETIAARCENAGMSALAVFCRRHVFGCKLAANALESSGGRVLYADGDILWYGAPERLMEKYHALPIYGAHDYRKSYDEVFLGGLSAADRALLAGEPSVNAGLSIFNKPLSSLEQFDHWCGLAAGTSDLNHFTEQTIVALLVKRFGGVISSRDVEMVTGSAEEANDESARSPIARHYVTPGRRKFWPEARKLLVAGLAATESPRVPAMKV